MRHQTTPHYIITMISLFCVISSCSASKSVTQTEKQKITLYSTIPSDAIAIQIGKDSSFTCYFSYSEWKDSIYRQNKHTHQLENYFRYIDSVKQTNTTMVWGMIPDNVSEELLRQFFQKGHVFIQYKNGKSVKQLLYIKEINKKTEKQSYLDAAEDKTLYYYSLLKQGAF